MVLKKECSMPNEAVMSHCVPHAVPFASCQQQKWSINGFLFHAIQYVTCNEFQ